MTAKFQAGDEFSERWGNYIIVNVEEVLNFDEDASVTYVTTFDWEGVMDRQPAAVWAEYVKEANLQPVLEPSLKERLAAWQSEHENFPLTIPTGRTFIYDSTQMRLLHDPLTVDESLEGSEDWDRWTEMLGTDDGQLWYVADHEEYTLSAEEFGPIEECPVCGQYLLDDGTCPETGI